MTEERAKVLLNQIFDWIDATQERAGSLLLSPPRQSPLGQDDAQTEPLQLSHSLNTLVNAAIDHLHAIAALIRRAQMLHNSAPFTLARSAIEASATALWMLEPPTQSERVRRLVAYQAQDRMDAGQAWNAASTPAEENTMDLYQRQAADRIAQVVLRNAIREPPTRLPSTVKVLQEVDRALGGKAQVEFTWRLASGFAHGRQWASLHALTRDAVPIAGRPGLAMLALNNEFSRVLNSVGTAWMLTERVIGRYNERSIAPGK